MDASILLAFPLLLALSTSCNACKCKLPHPQTIFCGSDVVMLAKILKREGFFRNKWIVKVNVTKIFKGPLKAEEIHEIYTPRTDGECGYVGVSIPRNPLLIAGFLTAGKIYFTKCRIAYHWYRLWQEQRLGFETYYRQGCACKVEPCYWCWDACPEPDVRDCVWEQEECKYDYWNGEQTMQQMCFPSKTGRCQWTKIPINGSNLIPL